jgi:hypothetical protein
MRKVLLLLSILISFYTTCYNQIIKGTVLDQRTKSPIDNALVYFNGTSVGTYADKNGYFVLDISKNISMPLTISALGYNSITITDFSTGIPLLIQLIHQIFELKEVVITGKANPKARQSNLNLFKRTFLGTTPNAMNCEITNENDISLIFNSKEETLRAFSSKPIIINNKALGYKLFYYLNKFEFCKTNNQLILIGNYIFKEEPSPNKNRHQRFERRRETTYLGSRMHFFRALWENNLDLEGFIVKDSANVRLTYDNLVIQSDSLNISAPEKYLKYRGKLYITYGKKRVESSILMTKEYVYFDKIGFFDPSGIQWAGEMATQVIADLLPFEYSLPVEESTQLIQTSMQNTIKQDITITDQITGRSQLFGSIEEYVQSNQEPAYEKIFLHIDRTDYMQGDTIYFKAYLWYGPDQVSDTTSGILYIALINAEGKTRLTKRLLIQNGTTYGDFSLDSTITPGRYTLQAYTRWMLNPNTGNPFYQTITINPVNQNFQLECTPAIIKRNGNDSLKINFRFFEIDSSGNLKSTVSHQVNYSLRIGEKVLLNAHVQAVNTKDHSFKYSLADYSKNDTAALLDVFINDTRLNFKKQFRIPIIDNIDLQFFPEGGKLVIGLESNVAFKAIGADGLSRGVKGIIETGEGDPVTFFESVHKGMGTFILKPVAGKEYFARLLYENRNYMIPIPHAQEEGSVISVTYPPDGSDPFLTIKRTPSEVKTPKYIVGSSYGEIRFSALVKLTGDYSRFLIPVGILPEGVSRLTLLGNDFKPECERLIYVDKNQRFKIEIKPDSSSYGTRSKVTLLVKTTGMDGTPLQTDLSLTVVDKGQITKNSAKSGISVYKLLESEITGFIEDLDFYFRDDSCVNKKALDLLLLTQGYRTFLLKRVGGTEQVFLPETCFDFSGKLKLNAIFSAREKRYNYSQADLTLMYSYSGTSNFEQYKPDSLGCFAFRIPLMQGKSFALLQATNPRNRPLDAKILLDETVALPKIIPPVLSVNNVLPPSVEYIRQLQSAKKAEISKNPIYGSMLLNLPEVTITAKAKNWYRDFEHNPTQIVNLDSLDPSGNKYENVFDLLIREFGAQEFLFRRNHIKTAFLPCSCGMGPPFYLPIYIINGLVFINESEPLGVFYDRLNTLNYLPVKEIKRIIVIPPGDLSVYYYGRHDSPVLPSIVYIETYSDLTYRGDAKGVKTFLIDGMDAPRQFYSPRYEGSARNNNIYDGRVTLYWAPSIRTDSTGQAKIEFFTSDRKTVLEVIVNGIEIEGGNPGQAKFLIGK